MIKGSLLLLLLYVPCGGFSRNVVHIKKKTNNPSQFNGDLLYLTSRFNGIK